MKVLVQRVSQAEVVVNNQSVGSINQGLLVYVGFCHGDTEALFEKAADKLMHLRIFSNSDDKLDLNVQEVKGKLLVISQFTLYANCQRGRRPDFVEAMAPDKAEILYSRFIDYLEQKLPNTIEKGRFGADMQVQSINDGPLTFMLEWN